MEPFYRNRGFTLIEMLVVLGIIAAVTSVALASQSSFNRTLILANTAYDIALTLRSAENFGIGSRAISGTANAGYGVHFQRGTSDSFLLFADTSPANNFSCTRPDCRPGDQLYSIDDTLVQTYTLGNNIIVSNFCVFSDRWQCASTGDVSSLDIVFARPNPDASIRTDGSSYSSYTAACLVISSDRGGFRFVSVEASGQIIPAASSCP
ncbi:MAG: type II secretion system protein [Patescibacteria group bacterium]